MIVLDVGDQHAGERGDADVDQEAHRHVVGLEVDADHGAELEVDEQQQDVLDRGLPLAGHPDEGESCRPDDGAANDKERKVVKALDQQAAEAVDFPVHFRLLQSSAQGTDH
ncbi:hypothetical protein D3C83_55310 [compost metagenome]